MEKDIKRLLLIIDPQVDFVSGSLKVPGADKSMREISKLIEKEWTKKGDRILVTLDTHYPTHIGLAGAWKDLDSKSLPTIIEVDDVVSGKYTYDPKLCSKEDIISYIKMINEKGSSKHIVWPDHCIIGTVGNAVDQTLSISLNKWQKEQLSHVRYLRKGDFDLREMYSAFSYVGEEGNNSNKELVKLESEFDEIWICGLAKDICVSHTINDMIKSNLFNNKKVVILENCMASIDEESEYCKKVWDDARSQGFLIQ